MSGVHTAVDHAGRALFASTHDSHMPRAAALAACTALSTAPAPNTCARRSGYSQNARLTDAELTALPDCINLRIFSNVIYFTGRAYAGEDGLESLTSRADAYAKRGGLTRGLDSEGRGRALMSAVNRLILAYT